MCQGCQCTYFSSSLRLSGIYVVLYSFLLFLWLPCSLTYIRYLVNGPSGKGKSILTFGQTLWRGRRCYFRLFTHIINQATDIGVTIEFYRISQQEGSNECDDVRPFVLCIASILFIILYRVVTAFCLYSLTFRLDYIILQLFDVLILQSIVVNTVLLNNSITIKNNENQTKNKNKNKNKISICKPQMLIEKFSMVIQSFPQLLLQLYFIIQTKSQNGLILFSIFISFFSIISLLVIQDNRLLIETSQDKENRSKDKKKEIHKLFLNQKHINFF